MARPRSNTEEMQVGQAQSFDIPLTGSINPEDFKDNFEIVDGPQYDDQAKLLKFMEEPVKVMINDNGMPNAAQTIQLSVQGVNQFLIRGVPICIKRKFVEILARAKTEILQTPEYLDASGNRATRLTKSHVLLHPFSILEDRNPNGSKWLENILKEQ